MADNNTIQNSPQYYQAPLEVPGYVNPNVSTVPPVDIYSLMGVPPTKSKLATRKKSAYELMMDGGDPYSGLIPDVAPLQTNLKTLEPLDHDGGIDSYGYSSILHNGDNEDRYAKNFRAANPDLFGGLDINVWKDMKKIVYWGGGFLEKTLESAAVKTGQGLAGLYGLTIGNTLSAVGGKTFTSFDDWLANASDNVFSNIFDGWDGMLKERYHYFQEKEDRERKGFIQSLGDGDFWMNDISDGLGFLVSAAFEVGLISKLGLGTKLASRLGPLAEGVSTAPLTAQGAGMAGKVTQGLVRTANFAGLEGQGMKLLASGVDLTAQTLGTTAIEAMAEANETRTKVYDSFENKVNPETGMFYSEEEKKRLSAAAAGQVFKQNMSILIGPKFLETIFWNGVGKYAKGIFNKDLGDAGKASGRVVANEGLNKGVTYKRLSALNRIWSGGKLAGTAGLGFISEGLFEENIQLAISREADASFGAGDEFYRPGTSYADVDKAKSDDELFGSVGQRYVSQTKQFFKGVADSRAIDDELSKSVGIGGAFGTGGGLIHGTLQSKQQAKIDRYWTQILNNSTKNLFESDNFYATEPTEVADPNDPTKKIVGTKIVLDTQGQPVIDRNKVGAYLNRMSNVQGIMEIISNTENNKEQTDQELHKLAKGVLFANLAMDYVRAGKKDEFLKNLKTTSELSDKDITALGYNPSLMTQKEKANLLTRLTKTVERLDKRNTWIENNVLDNVSEKRERFGGLAYTKTQKQKRQQEFEAKKAYLRKLAMQHALLDTYYDEITESENGLGEPQQQRLSSITDPETGAITFDTETPLAPISDSWNSRINALRNNIAVLEKEFGYHWDDVLTQERNSPKAKEFNSYSKTNAGKNLAYSQMKADEALERMANLQAEHDQLVGERDGWLKENNNFELRQDDDGNFYVLPKSPETGDIERLNDEKVRRINGVKREEINIQKKWIEDEWRLTAALKEEKSKQGRTETYWSRRMSLSENAYNQYFQREAYNKDATLGQRRMKLWDKDEAKRVTAKQYKANEDKILKATRIEGKVRTILADINGQKLLAEIESLIDRDLPTDQFQSELQAIIENYKGQPIVLKDSDKEFINELIGELQDENLFVDNIYEEMPEDDRYNDKYYDLDQNGNYVIKQQFDSLQALAAVSQELRSRTDDYKKLKNYLDSIPDELPGDWSNPNVVRRKIADVHTETADSFINEYNKLSNSGQTEIAGDSFSSRQDLDKVNDEINELEQLKKIFEDRDKTDRILSTDEFRDFIPELEGKIATLKSMSNVIKERLSSRLKENRVFLEDAVHNLVEQLGLNFDGLVENQPLHDAVEKAATPEIFSLLKSSLQDLVKLVNKEDLTPEDRKAIEDSFWKINGQVAAVQEVIKTKDKFSVTGEIYKQLQEQLFRLQGTELYKSDRVGDKLQTEISDHIRDSVLGTLRYFFSANGRFTEIGSTDAAMDFYDDTPQSPIYKFREDMNLRKLIRNLEKDTQRTSANSPFTNEQILEFVRVAKVMQNLSDLSNTLNTTHSVLEQVEKEKEVVQAKTDAKDNKYENLIVPSIQQLFFIRAIGNFMRRDLIPIGFQNWIFIQAPGGAGKTQTLGTWFNMISGVPKDRVLATAFTEEASRGIKKALLVGEEGPKNAEEMAAALREFVRDKAFDNEVLIIDEFPAIDIETQRALFEAVQAYTLAKLEAGKGTFRVITLGDVNQLTFSKDGQVSPISSLNNNPYGFRGLTASTQAEHKNDHIAKLNVVPSLTINFRSNLFPVTSFTENFKGSNVDNLNADIKVSSTDPLLSRPDVKGVVSLSKASFPGKVIAYIKANTASTRTRALIVNENKMAQYKKLLEDAGIKVITDPNDEVSKGVYLTPVRNVQGFSFDEVFIDIEPNDKALFGASSVPNYEYNKAMYVATSRARNLVVVTNFSKIENLEDEGIADLESKAITELQTKDTEFVANRDLEIAGAKTILGTGYATTVKSVTPVKADTKATSALDEDEDEEDDATDEEDKDEDVKETEEEVKQEDGVDEKVDEENEIDDEESPDPLETDQVVRTDGVEDNISDDLTAEEKETQESAKQSIMDKIRDKAITAFNAIRKSVVKTLFPTAQTMKFKVKDGSFTVKQPTSEYQYRSATAGDRVMIVPFQQSKKSKSARKFGYAVITPAINNLGEEVKDSYRTLAVLSDNEIEKLKDTAETKQIYNDIEANELREKEFVSLLYSDVNSEDGFVSTASKDIGSPIAEGSIQSANTVKYFFGKEFKALNPGAVTDMVNKFIDNFYANQIADDPTFRQQAREFYADPINAQVIIPIRKDIESGKNTRARMNIPPDLVGTIQAGKPYLVLRPFRQSSGLQFISLSRRFLNTQEHGEVTTPIREFINLGKEVKKILSAKGLGDEKMGYSPALANLFSQITTEYMKDSEKSSYTIRLTIKKDKKSEAKEFTFSNVDAQKMVNLAMEFSVPSTQVVTAIKDEELKALSQVKKARNLTFDDGTTIYGTVIKYDPKTKISTIKDINNKVEVEMAGPISHTAKSVVGQTQKILNDIMNSNGHIARQFTSVKDRIGFVTDNDRDPAASKGDKFSKGYKFMNLLGSKTSPVAKTYDNKGEPKEYYEDVIAILEDLFNFANKGEIPAKQIQTTDNEGNRKSVQVKFRVPVPLNARDENGRLTHNYENSNENTSRDVSNVSNSKFFETNFEGMLPTQVYIEFGEHRQADQVDVQVPQSQEEAPKVTELVTESVTELTEDDLNELSFQDIRARLTPAQVKIVDDWASKNGFVSIDNLFASAESNHVDEQVYFRDYLIQCII